MNTFVTSVENQTTVTENGMKAYANTSNANVDFFFKAGAMRGDDIIPLFVSALVENDQLAIRNLLWLRDVREGAGERKLFRDVLHYLETNLHSHHLLNILPMIPKLGRWDDLLVFQTPKWKRKAFLMIKDALEAGDGLCAKWMPRENSSKKELAHELRKFLGLSPKQYRKLLSSSTKVVETQMCSNDWDNINFSHVPSKASSIYSRAFSRHTENYAQYLQDLKDGKKDVKVNAGAIYPYEVIRNVRDIDESNLEFIVQQWNALPNYIGDNKVLPMIDVSGSMETNISGSSITALDVAVSLGLYCADKNVGPYKDMFLTFSGNPKLEIIKGNIVDKINQICHSEWGMNTNLEKAFNKILDVAKEGNVTQDDMPDVMLILSDMQFDDCTMGTYNALEMISIIYETHGYKMPKVVFWNLVAHDNVPVKFNQHGVALISGFSPAIMKSVLNNSHADITPYSIMIDTLMKDRYNSHG